MITAGGATGAVVEIGLFATTIHTADNLRIIVGNNKILADKTSRTTRRTPSVASTCAPSSPIPWTRRTRSRDCARVLRGDSQCRQDTRTRD
jgi:hypothetical protein